MNKDFWEKILLRLENPSRVEVLQFKDGNYCIMSARNEPDTFDWFHVNSKKLQDYLKDNGLSYIYIFEQIKKRCTYIYLLVGKRLAEEDGKKLIVQLGKPTNVYIIENRDWQDFDAESYDESIPESYYDILRFCDNAFKILSP